MQIGRATGKFARDLLVGAALVAVLGAGANGAQATTLAQEAPSAVQFNIPAQNLDAALSQFARQSGQQLLFAPELVAGRRSNPLVGPFTPREGLMRLLAGSGIGFRIAPSGAFLLGNGGPAPVRPEMSAGLDERDRSDDSDIVVTGTLIRGVVDSPSPTTVVTRRDLDSRGYQTIEQAFRDLPQNFAGFTAQGRRASEGGRSSETSNQSQAEGIDLRGLGAGSTLVLFDGLRPAPSNSGRTVDIGAIPLLLVDRIEIVAGGRSSLYGSDAVAGVVNIVPRRRFEGLELSTLTGWDDQGVSRMQGSALAGFDSRTARGVVGFNHYRQSAYDLARAGLVGPTNLDPPPNRADIRDEARQTSVSFAGELNITDRISVEATALYTDDASATFQTNTGRIALSGVTNDGSSYLAALTLRAAIGDTWELRLVGSDAATNYFTTNFSGVRTNNVVTTSTFSNDTESRLRTARMVAEGPLPRILFLAPRLALGAEYRDESYSSSGTTNFTGRRSIRSAFGELYLPLGGDRRSGLDVINLSFSARADDYTDVGSTFNFQAGAVWRPLRDLSLKAAYGTAFRVPDFNELRPNRLGGILLRQDPLSPTGRTPVFQYSGNSTDLDPERAKNWTLSIDYTPPIGRSTLISASFYSVSYTDRIGAPATGTDLQLYLVRAERYPGLINRSPTEAQLREIFSTLTNAFTSEVPINPQTQNFLDVIPNLILVDIRSTNIAEESVRGLDFAIQSRFTVPFGVASFNFAANYTLNHTIRITPTSPPFELLNEVQRPVDFRVSSSVGLESGPVTATIGANYVTDYSNPFNRTQPYEPRMPSWTTFDLTIGFDGSRTGIRALEGLRASLTVNNVLDASPPRFIGGISGVRYDVANANPYGRMISLRLTKTFQ